MATPVKIPQVGESVTEVTLIQWLRHDGDKVEKDEPLCLMETDKADFELPSPISGILKTLHKEGETIEVGAQVAEVDGSDVSAQSESPSSEAGGDSDAKSELSPAVKRLIEEHNLNPADIHGSGRGGRIIKEDVLSFLETKQKKSAPKD